MKQLPYKLPGIFPYGSHARSITLISVIAFHALLLISPLIYFMGFSASVVVPGTLFLLLIVAALHLRRIRVWVMLVVLGSVVTSAAAGLYWESWRGALLPAYLAVSLLTVALANDVELRRVVRIGSWFLLVLVIGGWVAVALAIAGFPPQGNAPGIHGRVLYSYYTTLTPFVLGDYIRPAGIYDEPGALSMVICVFACLRHLMCLDRRFTWVLLILGFVTFSLAHLIYVTVHFLAERRVLVVWTHLLIALGIAVWVLGHFGIWDTFDARLLGRLAASSDSDKVVAGDNRSRYLVNAAKRVLEGDPKEFLFGLDDSCLEGSPQCVQEYPRMGYNPLSPLVYHGILISWPYYLFLAFTVIAGAMRRSLWPFLGVGLLYMQRPNVASAGYAMLAALTFIIAIRWVVKPMLSQVLGGSRTDESPAMRTADRLLLFQSDGRW